jgi:hypothetical protein
MNYYIIPKNKFNIKIELQLKKEILSPYISFSLIFYLNDIYNQLLKIDNKENNNIINYINEIVNPYEFIHTNVPGTEISVSKVKPESNIFFELMEIFNLFNINDIIGIKYKINIAHLTRNNNSTVYLLNMLREFNDDIVFCEDFDFDKLSNIFILNKFHHNFDLFIFELNLNDYIDINTYIKNILLIFSIIIKYQSNQGSTIIKLENIFYKPLVDVLFLFSALYDKIFIVKPTISNITKGERYIICKSFNSINFEESNILNQVEENIIKLLFNNNSFNIDNKNIHSIINNDISYYFLNKLEESNSVIGQQQLEAYDQIINIFKNKNREDKLETIKRNNIQKCIQWCEKNQLPHNKFIEQINIFLNIKKKDSDDQIKID